MTHGTATRVRVVLAQARPLRYDYLWPYENNTTVLEGKHIDFSTLYIPIYRQDPKEK
jgi:hypothetical protein